MPKKEEVAMNTNVLGPTGLNGKSITGVSMWRHGVVCVIEINYTGGPTYLKARNSQMEYGGTAEWGTGTIVT